MYFYVKIVTKRPTARENTSKCIPKVMITNMLSSIYGLTGALGWRDIVRIALYNLKFMSIIKGDSATSSFLLKDVSQCYLLELY
jgi:hypothetical protein